MAFDIDDCEFNEGTEDFPNDTPVKITANEHGLDPLEINMGDWRRIMEAVALLRITLHHLEDYSSALWAELTPNHNLDKLVNEIKEVI